MRPLALLWLLAGPALAAPRQPLSGAFVVQPPTEAPRGRLAAPVALALRAGGALTLCGLALLLRQASRRRTRP